MDPNFNTIMLRDQNFKDENFEGRQFKGPKTKL